MIPAYSVNEGIFGLIIFGVYGQIAVVSVFYNAYSISVVDGCMICHAVNNIPLCFIYAVTVKFICPYKGVIFGIRCGVVRFRFIVGFAGGPDFHFGIFCGAVVVFVYSKTYISARDRRVQGYCLHVRTLCPVVLLENRLSGACRGGGYGDLYGPVSALLKLEADFFHLICVFVFKLKPALSGAVMYRVVVVHIAVSDGLNVSRCQTADIWELAKGNVLGFFLRRRRGNL